MKKYTPNFISLRQRTGLAFAVMLLLVFITAVLANGYTFIPGRRGGVLLSGIPTLLVALSALALCFAALLTIIDHYDRRPNEHHYRAIKYICFKSALYLFFAALFFEFSEFLLRSSGIDIFPDFHGFAEHFTFYTPELERYIHYIQPLEHLAMFIGVMSIVLVLIGGLIKKYFDGVFTRLALFLISLGLFGMATLFLEIITMDFLHGEISANGVTYRALSEPAKFNAILLTNFIICAFLLLLSMAGIIGILTNRLKLNSTGSPQK